MKILLLLPLLLFSKEKVKKVYKQYEKIDLGSISVKGNIITPGDVSVRDRNVMKFRVSLPERKSFNPEMKRDFYLSR